MIARVVVALTLAASITLGGCSLLEPRAPRTPWDPPAPVLNLRTIADVEPDACSVAGLRVAADVETGPLDRERLFGGWRAWAGHPGQDTRDRILDRDLEQEQLDARGEAVFGVLSDPYTGATVVGDPGELVEIDHVVSVGLAYRTGAAGWTDAQRRDFANDDENLLAVSGSGAFGNAAKGDLGPERFVPPVNGRAYVALFAEVVRKYDLTVTPERRDAIERACA